MTTFSIKISPELIRTSGGDITIEIDAGGIRLAEDRPQTSTEPVCAYIGRLVRRMEDEGRYATAANYRCAMESFRRHCGGGDLALGELDETVIGRYEASLKRSKVAMNTISCYMRSLRAAYNRAVEEGSVTDRRPFRYVFTGMTPTRKRAVSIETIRAISRMTPTNEGMALARDLFMFSFYTRGMSFVDMAYLRNDSLRDGILTYHRSKTGQTLAIRWEQCMQDIVDARHEPGSDYLLPIIRNGRRDSRRQYKNVQGYVNRQLKRLAPMLDIGASLTMYAARHSWATIAKDMGAPLDVISAALGHTSAKTTQIYLKTIDMDAVDTINTRIIGLM